MIAAQLIQRGQKKTYEQKLYDLEHNIYCCKQVEQIVRRTQKLSHPLTQFILQKINLIYFQKIIMKPDKITIDDVLKVIQLVLVELLNARTKLQTQYQQFLAENFHKGLDDPQKWNQQSYIRRNIVLVCPQIQQQQKQHSSSQTGQYNTISPYFLNSATFFAINIEDGEVLNDALEIMLYHTPIQHKNLLQLIAFKMFRKFVVRKMPNNTAILQHIEGEFTQHHLYSVRLLNDLKNQMPVEKYYNILRQQIAPAQIQNFWSPESYYHSFIGTQTIYIFTRYLLVIYELFCQAKKLSQQGSKEGEFSLYSQFLTVMVHKISLNKETFQYYLQKIFKHQAYRLLNLNKFILEAVKLIQNIAPGSLTYKILKDGVKDYQFNLKPWKDYRHPTYSEQLVRLFNQNQPLYHFRISPGHNSQNRCLEIGVLRNRQFFEGSNEHKKPDMEEQNWIQGSMDEFMSGPSYCSKTTFAMSEKGEQVFVRKRETYNQLTNVIFQINKTKKFRIA